MDETDTRVYTYENRTQSYSSIVKPMITIVSYFVVVVAFAVVDDVVCHTQQFSDCLQYLRQIMAWKKDVHAILFIDTLAQCMCFQSFDLDFAAIISLLFSVRPASSCDRFTINCRIIFGIIFIFFWFVFSPFIFGTLYIACIMSWIVWSLATWCDAHNIRWIG